MGVKGYGSISISIVEDGVGISSRYSEYYLSTSSSELSGGSWSESIPDYIAGRYYWVREVTNWTDGTTTRGNPMYDRATTDLFIRSLFGLAMKINHSAFSTTSSGRAYLHGYDDGDAADVNGYIIFNGIKRNVTRGQIYPGNRVPYNRYIYIVLRLTAATATSGTTYLVWYNSGWKYAGLTSGSAATWTWNNTRDIALGQFILPGLNSDLVEAYLYNPVRSAESVQTTSSSPYQYSQSAVEWYNANGSTTVDATTMLAAWADGAFSATTEINGGFIKAHTIQSEHLATDAIMSNNFQASSQSSSPFSATGTYLDLTNGNLYSPNFGIDNTYGVAYLNGEIIATSGRIGNSAATNYWEIGTKTDYNAQQSAALIGHGTSYIQSGDWQISNNRIDTRMYDAQNKITYLNNNNTYWDFGMQVPELDTTATGYVSGISNNWLYIRKHANTIPELETDWNYIFRIDETGMIYINGKSLDEKYASIDGVSGEYLPRTGGTITGDLTVNGTLNATANKAKQLTHSLTINGTAWDGSSNTTIGTMGVAYGGTGKSSWTANRLLYTSSTSAISEFAAGTSGQILKSMGSNAAPTWVNQSTIAAGSATNDSDGNQINTTYRKLSNNSFTTITAETLNVEDVVATGTGSFTGGITGDLTGNATSANKVNKSLKIQLNGGTTEGTNQFTFDGSAAKSLNITKSSIGLGNVANTADADKTVKQVANSLKIQLNSGTTEGTNQFTFNGSAAKSLNITKSSIGLGNVTNNAQVKGLASGTTNGHFVSWGSDGYTVADSGYTPGQVVKTLASNNDGKLVLTYLDGTTSDPIEVKIIGSSGSSVSFADALNVNGVAVGSATQPVYIDNQGKPQTANSIPKLNNGTTGGTFYAPTGAGTSGQVLKSSGSGAPTWVNQSTLSVGSATKATQDSDGNAINTTYVKKAGDTMTGDLYIEKTSTISANSPARILFTNKQSDNNITTTAAFIAVYDDHDTAANGQNMVIKSGGNMIIGSGESPTSFYTTVINDKNFDTSEAMFITADTSLSLYANCNTIGNRLGAVLSVNHEFYPIVGETGTNNVGSIGTSSYKWANIYATTLHGALDGNAATATKATQDGSGNVITSTYAPLASPTFTGKATSPYYLATTQMTVSAAKLSTHFSTAPMGGLFADGVGFTNPTTRNDVGWIRVTGTGEADTVMELATGDDSGNGEQIVARQYNTSNTVVREMKLLDTSGNTTIPGTFTIASGVTMKYTTATKSLDFIFN